MTPLATRLRAVGGVVLVAGLVCAGLFYWKFARPSTPTIDQLLPGYSRQQARQTAILMGGLVVAMLGWWDALKDPSAQAMIIAGGSVVVALACFRVASLLERPVADTPIGEEIPAPHRSQQD